MQDGPHEGSDHPPSCHHDASVRSIDIGLEEDRLTGKSSEKKEEEVAHLTWDSYDVLLMLSFCARVQMHLFLFFFQNLYRLVQQGASILVGFHHWLSVGMLVG